jgi:hypothetical protein
MKMNSYLVEGLADGQSRWTVSGGDHEAVRTGTAKGEHKWRSESNQLANDKAREPGWLV